jgi:RNA polymerase sigma-70 factor (ECF subfamily)
VRAVAKSPSRGHNSIQPFDVYEYMDAPDDVLLCSGDLEDFGRFYDRYARTLLGFFQRRTGDPEVAADLTAETFAAALVARSRYRPQPAGAGAWLFTIARHKLTDYLRRGHAEDRMRTRLAMEPVPLFDEDIEMIRWLGEEVATQMVDELPEDQRDVIRAHVLDDQGYAEIARTRRLSEETVRKRVSRGLKVLRERAGGNR